MPSIFFIPRSHVNWAKPMILLRALSDLKKNCLLVHDKSCDEIGLLHSTITSSNLVSS